MIDIFSLFNAWDKILHVLLFLLHFVFSDEWKFVRWWITLWAWIKKNFGKFVMLDRLFDYLVHIFLMSEFRLHNKVNILTLFFKLLSFESFIYFFVINIYNFLLFKALFSLYFTLEAIKVLSLSCRVWSLFLLLYFLIDVLYVIVNR